MECANVVNYSLKFFSLHFFFKNYLNFLNKILSFFKKKNNFFKILAVKLIFIKNFKIFFSKKFFFYFHHIKNSHTHSLHHARKVRFISIKQSVAFKIFFPNSHSFMSRDEVQTYIVYALLVGGLLKHKNVSRATFAHIARSTEYT